MKHFFALLLTLTLLFALSACGQSAGNSSTPSQFDDPEAAIDLALKTLHIEYIDLMLLHHPGDGADRRAEPG